MISDHKTLRVSMVNSHILIGGTGRAGTTMLVQLFTILGFDTGFTVEQVTKDVNPVSRAGLEFRLNGDKLPHVIKSPWLSEDIQDALDQDRIRVESAIVPIRDLFSAAESRRRVYYEASRLGKDPWAFPGSLWKVDDPRDQEARLAIELWASLKID